MTFIALAMRNWSLWKAPRSSFRPMFCVLLRQVATVTFVSSVASFDSRFGRSKVACKRYCLWTFWINPSMMHGISETFQSWLYVSVCVWSSACISVIHLESSVIGLSLESWFFPERQCCLPRIHFGKMQLICKYFSQKLVMKCVVDSRSNIQTQITSYSSRRRYSYWIIAIWLIYFGLWYLPSFLSSFTTFTHWSVFIPKSSNSFSW